MSRIVKTSRVARQGISVLGAADEQVLKYDSASGLLEWAPDSNTAVASSAQRVNFAKSAFVGEAFSNTSLVAAPSVIIANAAGEFSGPNPPVRAEGVVPQQLPH